MITTSHANVVVTAILQIVGRALQADPALRAELAELLATKSTTPCAKPPTKFV